MARPRSRDIPSSTRFCKHHDKDCEHRQWRRGLDDNGNVRLVWICAEWQNEANKASYARSKRNRERREQARRDKEGA